MDRASDQKWAGSLELRIQDEENGQCQEDVCSFFLQFHYVEVYMDKVVEILSLFVVTYFVIDRTLIPPLNPIIRF